MKTRSRSLLTSLVAFLLIFALIYPIHASTVESRASDYLNTYGAYVYPTGWYKVQVWFNVDGVTYMDEIGALTVWLYESSDNENWTLVKTFKHTDYPDMLGYNDYYHSGHVEYPGAIGKYYKAYISVWAGKDGDGDTRYFWTSPVKATLFAASRT